MRKFGKNANLATWLTMWVMSVRECTSRYSSTPTILAKEKDSEHGSPYKLLVRGAFVHGVEFGVLCSTSRPTASMLHKIRHSWVIIIYPPDVLVKCTPKNTEAQFYSSISTPFVLNNFVRPIIFWYSVDHINIFSTYMTAITMYPINRHGSNLICFKPQKSSLPTMNFQNARGLFFKPYKQRFNFITFAFPFLYYWLNPCGIQTYTVSSLWKYVSKKAQFTSPCLYFKSRNHAHQHYW